MSKVTQTLFRPYMTFETVGGMKQVVGSLYSKDAPKDEDGQIGIAAIVSLETNMVHTICRKWTVSTLARHITQTFNLKGVPDMCFDEPKLVGYDDEDVLILT